MPRHARRGRVRRWLRSPNHGTARGSVLWLRRRVAVDGRRWDRLPIDRVRLEVCPDLGSGQEAFRQEVCVCRFPASGPGSRPREEETHSFREHPGEVRWPRLSCRRRHSAFDPRHRGLTTQFSGPRRRAKPAGAGPLQLTLRLTRCDLRRGREPEEHHERRQTSSTPARVACTQVAAHTPSVRRSASCAGSEGSLERSCSP